MFAVLLPDWNTTALQSGEVTGRSLHEQDTVPERYIQEDRGRQGNI